MNYTLKQLTRLSFEDWCRLIEIEDGVTLKGNKANEWYTPLNPLYERALMKYYGTIELSSLREHAVCNSSTV